MEVWTKELVSQDFQGGLGVLAMEFTCNMIKPLWVIVKTYIPDSSLCVLKGLVGMINIVIYGSLLVKKFRNWKTGIHRYEIYPHCFLNKENDCLSGYWKGVHFDVFVVKNESTIFYNGVYKIWSRGS